MLPSVFISSIQFKKKCTTFFVNCADYIKSKSVEYIYDPLSLFL